MHFGSPSDPSQTPAAEAKPRYVYSILKPHGQSFRRQVRPLLREAKPSYVYSILKPPDQSSRSPVRPLLRETKPSYVYSILKPPGQSCFQLFVQFSLLRANLLLKNSHQYLLLKGTDISLFSLLSDCTVLVIGSFQKILDQYLC